MLLNELLKSKKGIEVASYKMLMWIPDFIFTIIVIGMTVYILSAFVVSSTDVAEVETSLISTAAFYSPNALSYADSETGRIYPGVVGLSRLSNAHLEKHFGMEKPLIVGRFVKAQAGVSYYTKAPEERSAYTDEERYKLWQPIAKAEGKGRGSRRGFGDVRYVTTSDGSGAIVETVFIVSS